jgi:cell division septum initiation protein DivIVA
MHRDTGPDQASAGASVNSPGAPSDAAQAAHLLEMTARDAEQWLSEARSEAASLVDDARAEADRLVRAGRDEAEAVLSEARTEADRVRAELDRTKRDHEAEVAELQRLATEQREDLRRHLTDLLGQVGGPHKDDDSD